MRYSIRTATAADAADFAHVLCESWKAAYRDILTPEQLAAQTDLTRRTAFFEHLLPDPGCFLARDGDAPCGICSVSPERSGALPGWGEVVALYTLPAYWGSEDCVLRRLPAEVIGAFIPHNAEDPCLEGVPVF